MLIGNINVEARRKAGRGDDNGFELIDGKSSGGDQEDQQRHRVFHTVFAARTRS